jgi:hypothetical protein
MANVNTEIIVFILIIYKMYKNKKIKCKHMINKKICAKIFKLMVNANMERIANIHIILLII